MKVYVLYYEGTGETEILGVFTSKEDANKQLQKEYEEYLEYTHEEDVVEKEIVENRAFITESYWSNEWLIVEKDLIEN